MNTITRLTFATALAALLLSGGQLTSQTQVVAVEKTPEQRLVELKAANAELLEQQKASREKLDLLLKEAEQLRIFSKRG